MSGGKMPTFPTSARRGFSSTPLKLCSGRRDLHDECVSSDDDDTFSLLSPIYHDSFDSDEDLDPAAQHQRDEPRLSSSPLRCELPKTGTERLAPAVVEPAASPTLGAWAMWLVSKAKDDRLKLEKTAEEERLLKEKKKRQEREQEQKKIVMEEKIHGWLKMKREQERQEQLLKQSIEQEEIQRQRVKRREAEQKAAEKYKEWARKKHREKREKEKREKDEALRKEEQEKERRRRAEEKFQEWVASANERSRESPKSPCNPRSPYDSGYPSPSFYNPIPWKPNHVPRPETPQKDASRRKPQRQPTGQRSPRAAVRWRHAVCTAQSLP